MRTTLVVIGAGGFGREALDVAEAMNEASDTGVFEILGVIDDMPSELNLQRLAARGIAYLGVVARWLESVDAVATAYVVGIGNPAVRERVSSQFASVGATPATLVHPRAGVGSNSTLGAGTVVCAGVQISTNVTVGRHVHLNPNATIGHDTVIGDFVSVNPGAVLSGDLTIHDTVLVGAGAIVLQGLTVGGGAVVGASACVVRSVQSGSTVKGVPAR